MRRYMMLLMCLCKFVFLSSHSEFFELYNKSLELDELGKVEESVAMLFKADSIATQDNEKLVSKYGLGLYFYYKKDHERAVKFFEESNISHEKVFKCLNYDSVTSIALSYLLMGQKDKYLSNRDIIENKYIESIKKGEYYSFHVFNLSHLYYANQEFEKAEEVISAIEMEKNDIGIFNQNFKLMRLLLLYKLSKFEAGKKFIENHCNSIKSGISTYVGIKLWSAIFYYRLGEIEEAKKEYDLAMLEYNQHKEKNIPKSKLLKSANDIEIPQEAISDLERIEQLFGK